MPLNLGGGSFTPFIKYNAKSGKWSARFQGSDREYEFECPTLVYDFDNIKTGWIRFGQSGPPRILWDPSLTQEAPKPTDWGDKVLRGFRVLVYGKAPVPGINQPLGVRELMSNSGAMNKAIAGMYERYEAGLHDNLNALPVFKNTECIKRTGAFGAVYEPVFELVQWAPKDRVPELASAGHEEPAHDDSYSGNFGGDTAAGPPVVTYMEDDLPY